MSFGEAISDGFSKYATFSGRSSRSAYWWWILFYVLVFIVASVLDGVINTPAISILVWLGFFLPNLAVLVRRLHDTDHSGWWVLIGLIPLIGAIVLIVFACLDSGPPNKYGQGPDDRGELAANAAVGQAPQASERAPD
jgi:uncharacterized membrane protein YhaH (DUF805 family)